MLPFLVTMPPKSYHEKAPGRIAAPPARVFQAISDPSQLQRWWGQHGLYHVTKSSADVRTGGKWRSDGVGPDGKEFFAEGEYLEVDSPFRLVHTWVGSYDSTRTVVRWELEAQTVNELHPSGPKKAGTGTRLRITQEEFAGNIGPPTNKERDLGRFFTERCSTPV
jgi:uncharacterized protein YndB with AHSA1/START domain